jgi:hypothetical protein
MYSKVRYFCARLLPQFFGNKIALCDFRSCRQSTFAISTAMKSTFFAAGLLFSSLLLSCGTTSYRSTPNTVPKSPAPEKQTETSRPEAPGQGTNPPNSQGGNEKPGTVTKRPVYRLAVVLPFLTDQSDPAGGSPSSKSEFAAHFYGGMQLAFESISILAADYPSLMVDILDSKGTEEGFDQLFSNPRLSQAEVIIGPTKNAQISKMAEWAKTKRKIVVSPQSPSSGLVEYFPGFVQLNPSLKTHCARVVQYLRKEKYFGSDQLVLVGKEREADRFVYFQEMNKAMSGAILQEIIVPDNSPNFEKIDFGKYCRPGKTTAFLMPSWAGQDWVVAFLSRLKKTKGSNLVEVYGLPQWLEYAQIEAELLRELNVHLTSASYIDRKEAKEATFERAFYDKFGTLPEEDAFNGWDTAFFVASMLQQYGLSFPEKASAEPVLFPTFRGGIYLRRNQTTSAPVETEAPASYHYAENILVHILRFEQYDYIKI